VQFIDYRTGSEKEEICSKLTGWCNLQFENNIIAYI